MAEEEFVSLRSAMAQALRMGGSSLLSNPKQLVSRILDLADSTSPEVKIVQRHMDATLCAPLLEASSAADEAALLTARSRVIDELQENRFVSPELAQSTASAVVGGMADWLGLSIKELPISQTTESETSSFDANPVSSPAAEEHAEQRPQEGPEEDLPKAPQEPQPTAQQVPQPDVQPAQQDTQPPKKSRGPLIAAILAVAAVAVGLFFAFGPGRGPIHYQIVASVKAPGLDGGGTRIPVRVTGKDTAGTDVAQDAYLAYDGTGLSLTPGTYDVAVQGSPIASDGGLYYVDDIVLSLEVPDTGDPNAVLEVPADQSITLRQKPDIEITERDIADAKNWAEKDKQEQGSKGASDIAELVKKVTVRRENAIAAKEKADKEAREKAEQEAREKAEREAQEKAEQEAREKAEREAQEKAEQEAREKAEREAASQFNVSSLNGWYGYDVGPEGFMHYVSIQDGHVTLYDTDGSVSEEMDFSASDCIRYDEGVHNNTTYVPAGWYIPTIERYVPDGDGSALGHATGSGGDLHVNMTRVWYPSDPPSFAS